MIRDLVSIAEASPHTVKSLIPPQAMPLKGQEHQTIIPSLHPSINPTLTLFQKELQAATWQWLSSLNQTSV